MTWLARAVGALDGGSLTGLFKTFLAQFYVCALRRMGGDVQDLVGFGEILVGKKDK